MKKKTSLNLKGNITEGWNKGNHVKYLHVDITHTQTRANAKQRWKKRANTLKSFV